MCGGVCSFAETYGSYTYIITDNKVTITKCNASAAGRKNIPETIEGYPVTSIAGGAFSFCYYITSVTIPDTVTSIGWDAFANCSELQSVTIGKGVTSIGSRAFAGCMNLSSVSISDLTAWCNIDFADEYSNPLCQKADYLIIQGWPITDLVIPEGITQIKPYAFYSCGKLASVQFRDGVTAIGKKAFYFCDNIENLIIPASVTLIGESAFYDPDGITKVYYSGSEEDWNEINKGSYLEHLNDSITHNAIPSEKYTLASDLSAGAFVIFAYCNDEELVFLENKSYKTNTPV
ncbi:MAG: leucine-rich repeat domain-containing protein, partial [Clostridia bacterium]|nr:leucine-rich repeat domain-containing protein [Clostridia bacterium]